METDSFLPNCEWLQINVLEPPLSLLEVELLYCSLTPLYAAAGGHSSNSETSHFRILRAIISLDTAYADA
jgi:hypothetical protein